MAKYSTKEGAPTYHSTSAHGRMANKSVTRRERYVTDFTAGLMIGLLVSAAVFLVILWAWVIPTMDEAVRAASQAVMLS